MNRESQEISFSRDFSHFERQNFYFLVTNLWKSHTSRSLNFSSCVMCDLNAWLHAKHSTLHAQIELK